MVVTDEQKKQAAELTHQLHLKALNDRMVFRIGFAQLWEIIYGPMGVSDKGRDLLCDVYMSGCRHAFEIMLSFTSLEDEEAVVSHLHNMTDELEEFNAIFLKKYGDTIKKGVKELQEKIKSHSQTKAEKSQD